jgi:hypothetical protein
MWKSRKEKPDPLVRAMKALRSIEAAKPPRRKDIHDWQLHAELMQLEASNAIRDIENMKGSF